MSEKFPLGRVVVTPGALAVLTEPDIAQALRRHQHGDWGEVGDEDKAENELALAKGLRLLSSYSSSSDVKYWIITEADRSATRILLPSEY